MEKQTPLMRQYNQVKSKHPDSVLLFRMGDFFETFGEDAVLTSKVCGIVLTKRNHGGSGDVPLAGFPHHQLDAYLPKLVRAGYRVAVCEQLEDPKHARGIVRRGVVEVVTPGVALYDKLLDTKKNNFVASVFIKTEKNKSIVGLSFADASTGEFFTSEFPLSQFIQTLENIQPAEIIISKSQKVEIQELIKKLSWKPSLTKLEPWIFDFEFGKEALLGQFKTQNLKGYGIEDYIVGIVTAGAVLYYIKETQNGNVPHFCKISTYNPSEFMELDFATRRNLEITFSMADNYKDGTLISILDKSCTAMGGRLFKNWLSRPLLDLNSINLRLDAVESLFNNEESRKNLRLILEDISDLERLISRITTGRSTPRDIVSLKNSLNKIPEVISTISILNSEYLNELSNKLNPLNSLIEIIDATLIDEPTAQLGTGNVFKSKVSSELDEYVKAKFSGKKWISEYQDMERQRSGISTLKVSFNNVFGYYIEITHANKNRIPENYNRKQTLTNAERYITPELKTIEEKILNAEEKISDIEYVLFNELRQKINIYTLEIQNNALLIGIIDCLQSFAESSRLNNYIKPEINTSEKLDIIDGRHPVVEKLLQVGENFTPNSTCMDLATEQLHILTGPNMSGKSCYLRQVGLIVLLGQIGCFVPATSAKFGIVDRIFTRVGAQDNITSGESTFLVEMQEAANIINNATKKSLILLDEVGRGTATYDGISIAWAISEYIHDVINAKTLFATHYHELNELASRYDRIANYKVEVIEAADKILFTHKVLPGASDHSFGIHVAQMAGMPLEITKQAYEIMKNFEVASTDLKNDSKQSVKQEAKLIIPKKQKRIPEQLSIFEFKDDSLRERLLNLDINNMTPVEAIKTLHELYEEARR